MGPLIISFGWILFRRFYFNGMDPKNIPTMIKLSKASKDRMEALKRKMSNVPGTEVPTHPVPGAS